MMHQSQRSNSLRVGGAGLSLVGLSLAGSTLLGHPSALVVAGDSLLTEASLRSPHHPARLPSRTGRGSVPASALKAA
jgi:hypothetical protein